MHDMEKHFIKEHIKYRYVPKSQRACLGDVWQNVCQTSLSLKKQANKQKLTSQSNKNKQTNEQTLFSFISVHNKSDYLNFIKSV